MEGLTADPYKCFHIRKWNFNNVFIAFILFLMYVCVKERERETERGGGREGRRNGGREGEEEGERESVCVWTCWSWFYPSIIEYPGWMEDGTQVSYLGGSHLSSPGHRPFCICITKANEMPTKGTHSIWPGIRFLNSQKAAQNQTNQCSSIGGGARNPWASTPNWGLLTVDDFYRRERQFFFFKMWPWEIDHTPEDDPTPRNTQSLESGISVLCKKSIIKRTWSWEEVERWWENWKEG